MGISGAIQHQSRLDQQRYLMEQDMLSLGHRLQDIIPVTIIGTSHIPTALKRFLEAIPRDLFENYVKILRGEHMKKRTIVLVGPSNTGKSFLGRMLSLSTWTTGMIDRSDAGNPHAYAYAFVNKTTTLLEEPLFTVDNMETMKLVMGGEPMLVNPKNQQPFICHNKACLIMTCNDLPWKRFETRPYENRSFIYKLTEPIEFPTLVTADMFWSAVFNKYPSL